MREGWSSLTRLAPFFRSIVIAFAAIGFAIVGRLVIQSLVPGVVPFALTYPAIILAGLLGGWSAGFISIAGCQLLIWYFILPPSRSFMPLAASDAVSLAVSSLSQLLALVVVVKYQEASEKAHRDAAEGAAFFQLALAEMDHRTKNNFMIAASLLKAQAVDAQPEVAAELKNAVSRLMSIAATYSPLSRSSQSISQVRLDAYLGEICEQLKYGLLPPGIVLTFVGEAALIEARSAVNIGLITNEWITNAVKYAFPDGFGSIQVRLRRVGDRLELTVADDGIGAEAEDAAGRGSQLTKMLAASFDADLKLVNDGGTRCVLMWAAAQG